MKRSTMVFLLLLAAALIAAGLLIEAVPGISGSAYETLYNDTESTVTSIRAELRDMGLRIYVNHNDSALEVNGAGRASTLVTAVPEGDALLLTEREPSWLARLFGSVRGNDYAVVWLPSDFAGTLTLSTDSGELSLSGLDLPGAGAGLTAQSGEVSVYDCRLGALEVRSGSGGAWLGDVDVFSAVSITSGSGRVSVSAAEMEELTVYLGSGEAWSDSLRAGPVKILAGSGDVSLSSGDVGDLTIETGSGEIYTDRMRAGTMALSSGSGGVFLSSGEADALSVTTGSGNISLDRFRADRAELFSRSGDIRGTLSGRNGDPSVETSSESGDVSLVW